MLPEPSRMHILYIAAYYFLLRLLYVINKIHFGYVERNGEKIIFYNCDLLLLRLMRMDATTFEVETDKKTISEYCPIVIHIPSYTQKKNK